MTCEVIDDELDEVSEAGEADNGGKKMYFLHPNYSA